MKMHGEIIALGELYLPEGNGQIHQQGSVCVFVFLNMVIVSVQKAIMEIIWAHRTPENT